MKLIKLFGLLAAVWLAFAAAAMAQPVQGFNASVSVSGADYYSYTLAVGDLLGTGYPVAVQANYDYSTLSVFTNDGTGKLAYAYDVSPANCSEPFAVNMFTNLLGDGRVVVAYVDYEDNNLTILTNSPATGLGVYQQLPTGSGPYGLASAFNLIGDNRFSLVEDDSSDNTLTIFTNNGSGIFGQFTKIATGGSPQQPAAADLFGSGQPALACVNSSDNTLTIYTNAGNGVFYTNATYAVGKNPVFVTAVSNLIGDHQFSLVVVNQGDNTLTILTNNGSGVYGLNATLAVGSGAGDVVAVDLFGRGHLDLVCSDSNDSQLLTLTNNGSGVFTPDQYIPENDYGYQVVPASLDGSTNVALVVTLYGSGLQVITQDPALAATPPGWSYSVFQAGKYPISVASGGGFQLITADQGTAQYTPGTLTIYDNDGTSNQLVTGIGPLFIAEVTNLLGDGNPAFIGTTHAFSSGANEFNIFTNNGSGGLAVSQSFNDIPADQGVSFNAIAVPGLINSGTYAIVTSDWLRNGGLAILTNNGAGTFGLYTHVGTSYQVRHLTSADLFGTGQPAIIYCDDGANSVTILTNLPAGDGAPARFFTNATLSVGAQPACVQAVFNLIGDNQYALVTADRGDNTLTILTNNGGGVYGLYATLPVGANPGYVTAADVYSRGHPDLLCSVTDDGGSVLILTNNGSGIFSAGQTLPCTGAAQIITGQFLPGKTNFCMYVGDNTANTVVFWSLTPKAAPPVQAPVITWNSPAPIIYGTALGADQLNAQASVPGAFAYSSTNGTVLNTGTNTLTAVFTPTDLVAYSIATKSLSIVVLPATLTVTVSNTSRAYGQSSPEFTGSITGLTNGDVITPSYYSTLDYDPAAGVYPGVITFRLVDEQNRLGNYTIITNNGTLTITKVTPGINWTQPPAIGYGTPLDTNQLNAQALGSAPRPGLVPRTIPQQPPSIIPGNYVYTPPAGTVLGAGTNTLTVVFLPTDAVDYNSATNTTQVVVLPGSLTITAANVARVFNTPNPAFTGTISGLTNSDNITATYASSALAGTAPGVYSNSIIPTLVDPRHLATNYVVTLNDGTLTILKISPVINWSSSPAITYGAALATNQLDATTTVAGSFAYTPSVGTVLPVGTNTLTAIFTPANTVDYLTTTTSVQQVVSPVQISAGSPALNFLTGLYEEKVVVNNPGASVRGIELLVSNLTANVTLNNATGVTNGLPYAQFAVNVPAGGSETLLLQFASSVGAKFTNTVYAIGFVPPAPTANTASGLTLTKITVDNSIPNSPRYTFGFATSSGKTYQVLYSDNYMVSWSVAATLTARGNAIVWTGILPPTTGSRSFKVVAH